MTNPRVPAGAGVRQRLTENLDRFRAAEALYREGQGVSRVRVDEIDPADTGVKARVSLLPTRGLYNQRDASWSIYSSWDTFGCSEDRWDAPYISLTMYFDAGLIEAVVRACEAAPREEYDGKRFDEIGKWIRDYRKSLLANRLTPKLKLYFQEQFVGDVTDHSLARYPDVQGKFSVADVAPALRAALVEYARWWSSSSGDLDDDVEGILRGWRLETGDGQGLEIAIPLIDFEAGTIEWELAGRLPGKS